MNSLSTHDYLILVTLSNYAAVFGGVCLWVALFLLGLIARRLEKAFEVPTGWRLLQFAPSGILVYTIYTLVQAGPGQGGSTGYALERQIACVALIGSGLFCLVGALFTYQLLRDLARKGPS